MHPRSLSVAASLLVALAAPVQGQAPSRLTGTVDVDLPRGGIAADLCLAGLPARGDTVGFVLHRGMNVKRVRTGAGVALPYDAEPDGTGLRYTVPLPAPDTARPAPAGGRSVCVEYTGAFPVYDVRAGDYRASDGSGVVAFNGRTLRARGETRWYPVPYDARTGQTNDRLAYRLRVRCPACRQLYLNGAVPQPGPEAELASDVPREVIVFAGDYPVRQVGGTYFLGEEVDPDTARLFLERVGEVQRFYAEFLGVPYGPSPHILRIIPVRVDRPGQFWGFFGDPALGLAGLTVGDFVQILGTPGHPARPPVLGVLSHELAHRYFAGMAAPGGEYQELFSEPFANYLSLKATRHFHGDTAYRQGLRSLQERAGGPELPRLDRADPRAVAGDRYRYGYAPLLLFALEREIGERRMRALLRALLTAPLAERAGADYAFLRRTALRAGVPGAVWRRWEERCVRPPLSGNQCLRELVGGL